MIKAILLSVKLKKRAVRGFSPETSLEELWRLAETASLEPVKTLTVTLSAYNPGTLIGEGKIEELKGLIKETSAKLVIFDTALTSAQQRNLERLLGVPAIERTFLILEIFSQRARTMEGRLQVKLARFSYAASRLTGKGAGLEQQHGMIGTRGPGERKIEYERRTLRDKIIELKAGIETIRKERQNQRKTRDALPMAQISLVGYTNSGKSTLLDRLTGGRHAIYTDDKLFATLDPATKRVKLPDGGWALFTDTVGFIQNLPHQLIAAFRSTLEGITCSDLIIHVHDGASSYPKLQHETVARTMGDMGLEGIPVINVFNKSDLVKNPALSVWAPASLKPVFVSALTGSGVKELLGLAEMSLSRKWKEYSLELPEQRSDLLRELYKACTVKKTLYEDGRIKVTFKATPENYARIVKRIEQALDA
ncbi:MAG TPA: GTPase HflX [Elusimicrobia bacterium]|nr:GTPase HflX [Elusimicrobiota bacterium]